MMSSATDDTAVSSEIASFTDSNASNESL
jgi:hypothetical protein